MPIGKMLALQRSRFGSNTFGARIDLTETFELNTTTKYVHVMIHKPEDGRVMLIGLGKRRERQDQSRETEQFWVFSSTKVGTNSWYDAVFPIRGNGGIDIHSLVVVVDAESPHARTTDFAAYIDEIVVNNNPAPRIIHGFYSLNQDEDAPMTRNDRHLTGITIITDDGAQHLEVAQSKTRKVYTPLLTQSITAKAGESMAIVPDFTSTWMNTYAYLDTKNDGQFACTLNADGTPATGSDVMAYSHYQGKNSKGEPANGNTLQLPNFKIPTGLAPGYYRFRFKVDWDCIDAGGNTESGNTIAGNGGAIVDTRLNIHADKVTVARSGGLNGDILTEDGAELKEGVQVTFGKPFTIVSRPAPEFELSYVTIKHGYNLSGDSIVNGTPQWTTETIPGSYFRNGKFTIPGRFIDGDVIVTPQFANPGVKPTPGKGDYAVNFDSGKLAITRTDRKLSSIQFNATKGGSSAFTMRTETPALVYRDHRDKQVSVVPGDVITPSVSYTGGPMHGYLYIDFNEDGFFTPAIETDGRPSLASELVSYSFYNNKNSKGTEVNQHVGVTPPSFNIADFLPTGVYRARFIVDWNSIDPGGRWSSDGKNKINENGGYVIDFLLNVHKERHPLRISTVNGSINGEGHTGLPLTVEPFSALSIAPTPIEKGYTTKGITIRHGHRLDGPQFVRGNRQWGEYTVSNRPAYTIPQDSVNGDVEISVNYQPSATAEYHLVFADEFNAPNGSLPDAQKWGRCPRQGATWSRWLSKTEEQHKLTGYISDGNFVAHALPNPDKTSDNVDMLTGGIKTMGKFGFTYGKVEGRLRTNKHIGNFPAFWMMPENQSAGWPDCGEIDIWEQIDNEDRSYHTVHSHWTYNLGQKSRFLAQCPRADGPLPHLRV